MNYDKWKNTEDGDEAYGNVRNNPDWAMKMAYEAGQRNSVLPQEQINQMMEICQKANKNTRQLEDLSKIIDNMIEVSSKMRQKLIDIKTLVNIHNSGERVVGCWRILEILGR